MSFTSTFNSLSVRGWQNPSGTSDRYYIFQNGVTGSTIAGPVPDFGQSVSMSNVNNVVAIGAPGYSNSQGRLYVYDFDFNVGGNIAGNANSLFGVDVAISSDANYVIAGTSTLSANTGYANVCYLDNTNNYAVQQTLYGGNVGIFGRRVAIADSNDFVAVQDYRDTVGNVTQVGSVRVFSRSGNTWTQQAKIAPNDPTFEKNFGNSISINGNATCIAIGANGDNNEQGAAYIFTGSGNTWTQQVKLTASDGANSDNFGGSIAMNSDASYVVIGAMNAGTGNIGAAYVYSNVANTWTEIAKITPTSSVITSFQAFGQDVSISDDGRTIAVGDFAAEISGQTVGSVYVFNKTVGNTYVQTQEIINPSITSSNATFFGQSISLSGDGSKLAIGNPGWENPGNTALQPGAVYLYKSF